MTTEPKLNSTLVGLLVLAIIILLIIAVYQLFFTPPTDLPNSRIVQISEEYGEDVFEYINK